MWLAFLAGWINRVELRARAEADVAALGLSFEREGFRWRVCAVGTVGAVPVAVRWATGIFGPSTWLRVAAGPWEEVPDGEGLADRVRARAVGS